MALYENVNGVIKEITAMSTNVGGTLKNMTLVHENVNGTLKQVFPKVIESKYNARILVAGGGGIAGKPGSSGSNFSSIGEIVPGLIINMDTSASGSSSGGSPTYGFSNKTLYDGSSNKYVYISSNCKVTVKITCGGSGSSSGSGSSAGTATFGINGVTKFNSSSDGRSYTATFSLTPNDYISAYSGSSATGAAGSSATYTSSVDYTLTFTSA